MKLGRCIKELDRIYGIRDGSTNEKGDNRIGQSNYFTDKTPKNDDEILQDLLETNIRQRGDVGGSAKKVGLRIKELERLYGIHQGNGSNQHEQKPNNSVIAKSQEQLASDMGISVDTLQNYKLLSEMIPELEELLDTGIVTKTTALAMMRNLSELEQLSPSLGWIKHCEKNLVFSRFFKLYYYLNVYQNRQFTIENTPYFQFKYIKGNLYSLNN